MDPTRFNVAFLKIFSYIFFIYIYIYIYIYFFFFFPFLFWAEPPADPRGTDIPRVFSGSPNDKILGRASGTPKRNEHSRKSFLEARTKIGNLNKAHI